MSAIAIYKLFGEKNIGSFGVAPRKRASRRSMRTYSLNDVGDLPPTLVLDSMNNAFQSKKLELFDRIKIGRQVSQKTCPDPRNGYFDSRVLSRTHAEVWSENGQVYIKDLKSSNGTYLNNRRLSPEGIESRSFELRSGDVLEFGIDVLETDQLEFKKVSCRVLVSRDSIMNSKDVLSSSPEKLPCTPRPNRSNAHDSEFLLEKGNQQNLFDLSELPLKPVSPPSRTSPATPEQWKDQLKTDLSCLMNAGFEITQLTFVLRDIASQFDGQGQEHVLTQELERTKAEPSQSEDRYYSLENTLDPSNKICQGFQTIRSKLSTQVLEKISTGKEGSLDKERFQRVAHELEEHQVFGNEHSKQQLAYNRKMAEFLEVNKRLSVENCELKERLLEERQASYNTRGSHDFTDPPADIGPSFDHRGSETRKTEQSKSKEVNPNKKEQGKELRDEHLRSKRHTSNQYSLRSKQTLGIKSSTDSKDTIPSTLETKECKVDLFGTATAKNLTLLRKYRQSPLSST